MKEGYTLKLLAQINFSEVPQMKDFPTKGILQFFIDSDDLYGGDFDEPLNQDGFRIVYHPEIEEDVKKEEVVRKIIVRPIEQERQSD